MGRWSRFSFLTGLFGFCHCVDPQPASHTSPGVPPVHTHPFTLASWPHRPGELVFSSVNLSQNPSGKERTQQWSGFACLAWEYRSFLPLLVSQACVHQTFLRTRLVSQSEALPEGTGSTDTLFGLNTFILQQHLQAGQQDRGCVVPDTVHRRVVSARRNRRVNRGDRPGVGGDPTRTLERELGSAGSSEQSPSTPSSSSLGGRTRRYQGGVC